MLDIDILLVSRSKYDINHTITIPIHSHPFYHFIFVISGTGEVVIQNKKYIAEANTVFIVKPDEMHSIYSHMDTPLNTIEVKFNSAIDWLKEALLNNSVISLSDNSSRAKMLLGWIIDEAISKNHLYEEIITLYFSEVIILLTRHLKMCATAQTRLPNEEYHTENSKIEKVVEYINRNYSQNVKLSELSEISSYSETYLCQLFKKIYGISLLQAINCIRLQKAKELLMYSTYSITEIADFTGFQSIHYFSRYFSEKEGMSPLEFRHSIKKNIYVFFNKDLYPHDYSDGVRDINFINENSYIVV